LKKNTLYKFIIAGLILFLSGNSYSQNKKYVNNTPKLNGNQFVLNNFIPNPFVKTYLNSSLGIASSLSTEIPDLLFDSTSNIELKADITYANGLFEFQYAVQDWAAIWLNVSGVARLGTNKASIFAAGVTVNSSFETGMLFKIIEFKKSLFSASVKLQNSSSTVVNLYPYIKGLLDSTAAKTALVNDYNPLFGGGDVRAAYSPNRAWNFLGFFQGGYGETVGLNSGSIFSYQFGGTVNFNMNESNNVPIGITGGFKLNSVSPTLDDPGRLTQNYLFEIAYTGRDEFQLSLASNYLRIPVRVGNLTINLTSYSFNWVYFF